MVVDLGRPVALSGAGVTLLGAPSQARIDVSVDGNTLTVRAERTAPGDAGDWLVAERPRGRYSRQLTLGRDLDVEKLHASYIDGVLTLTIPVAERAKPRQIKVEHSGAPTTIEGHSIEASGGAGSEGTQVEGSPGREPADNAS